MIPCNYCTNPEPVAQIIKYKVSRALHAVTSIGGHGTLEKYRGTGTRYFAKISTAVPVPVLSN